MFKHFIYSLIFSFIFSSLQASDGDEIQPPQRSNPVIEKLNIPSEGLFREESAPTVLQGAGSKLNPFKKSSSSSSKLSALNRRTYSVPNAQKPSIPQVRDGLNPSSKKILRRGSESDIDHLEVDEHGLKPFKDIFKSTGSNHETSSPRGNHPLSDLNLFIDLKTQGEMKKKEKTIWSLEKFLEASNNDKEAYAINLESSNVWAAPVLVTSRNLFGIENAYMARLLLAVLGTEHEKDFASWYEGQGLPFEGQLITYIFYPKNPHKDWVNLSLPCINKVGKRNTKHGELERALRSAALFTSENQVTTFLIDSFSRALKEEILSLIHPLNGAADVIEVSHIVHKFYPEAKQLWYGFSWGGAAVDAAHIKYYYESLTREERPDKPKKVHKLPKGIFTLNGLPLMQEEASERFKEVLRLNMHGTNDELFPHDLAQDLARANGTDHVSILGAGHNPHGYDRKEGDQLSSCLRFGRFCISLKNLPTIEGAYNCLRELNDWQHGKDFSPNSLFALPSLSQPTIRMLGEPDQPTGSWGNVYGSFSKSSLLEIKYGKSPSIEKGKRGGLLKVDLGLIAYMNRVFNFIKDHEGPFVASELEPILPFSPNELRYFEGVE